MNRILILVIFLFTQVITSQNQNKYSKNNYNQDKGFIKNEGQIIDQNGNQNEEVLYLLNTNGLNVQLRKNGFSYDVYEKKSKDVESKKSVTKSSVFNIKEFRKDKDSIILETLFHRIAIDFLDVCDDLVIREFEISKAYINYYNIQAREEGITKVKYFKKIVYENLYKGIDVEFFIPSDIKKPVEYNFVVRPEGDISSIKMKISGAEVTLKNNSLNMSLIHGNLSEIIPKSWVENFEGAHEIDISYIEIGKNTFGFKPKNKYYEKKATLIIDPTPVRQWATYYGGERDENQYIGNIETDSNGNIFVSGYTSSQNNIATSGSFQDNYTNDSWIGYLAKFSSDGILIWSTYYGNLESVVYGSTIDSQDNIIVVGQSNDAIGISTIGTHQTALYVDPNNYGDAFFVKFNNDGDRLWGTYYGGESADGLLGVTTDANLNIYAVGTTSSNSNISSPGSFRETVNLNIHDNWDTFIVKLNKDGQREWATYYGGQLGIAIDADSKGNVFILGDVQRGEADYENIATPGAYQENYSDEGDLYWTDSFLVKFNANGQRVWATFFGGDSYEFAKGLVVDHLDNVIICGDTRSQNFKTTNAFQPNRGGEYYYDWDAYLAKFNSNGDILWNTFYGGLEEDSGLNVDIDNDNNIYLVGGTSSSNNISTVDGYQENNINTDAYISKFSPLGDRLWGTYYGGESWDIGIDVELAKNGDLYLLGSTFGSTGLATPGAHQETFNGEIDNFLVKFKDCLSSINANAPEFLCSGEDISFEASGGVTYLWSGPNSFSSTEQNPVIQNTSINNSGTYSVYIESGDGCTDTKTFEILVSERPIAKPINNIIVCEDVYGRGISSYIDTSGIESQALGDQTNMVVSYFDSNGNQLTSPLPNPMTNSIPNTETITVRVSNDNNLECYAETSFEIIINSLPKINLINDISSCDDDNDGFTTFNLTQIQSDLSANNTNVAFYFQDGQQISNAQLNAVINKVQTQEEITVRVINTLTNCHNETTFKLIVTPLPIANTLTDIIGCDDNNDGIFEYFDTSTIETEVLNGQTGMEISYFNEFGNQLASPLPNPYTNTKANQETITVRVTDPQTGCYAETFLHLITSAKPLINQPATLYACDIGNGIALFNTSTIEHQLKGNQTGLLIFYSDENGMALPSPLPANYQNTKAWSQKINVRVENELNPLCYSETSFNLTVNELPQINLENDYFLCDLEPSLYIAADSNFDSWKWTFEDGSVISNSFEANLTAAGTYTLQITKINHGISCENSFSFNLVRSILPIIDEVKIQDISDNNSIEIITAGDGDFEYSLDGFNFQDDNIFQNLIGGVYIVQVRDKKGCGLDDEEVVLVDYPKFLTPNNDGFNDYWQIKGIEKFPDAVIYIFDRFGKLLKQLTFNDLGWDGTFNGKSLFASDYWFTADLGDGRTFKGHFSLKR